MNKPQLVLDIAGVLISNLSPGFWEDVTIPSNLSYMELKERFKREIREELWTGRLPEAGFWDWLTRQVPEIEIAQAQYLLKKQLTPLYAMDFLATWSESFDIHLLSNHRREWLEPLLLSVKPFVKSMTLSSSVGYCKPDRAIYQIVDAKLERHTSVLYIDDQEKNLQPARELGWDILIADQEGHWLTILKNRLLRNQME